MCSSKRDLLIAGIFSIGLPISAIFLWDFTDFSYFLLRSRGFLDLLTTLDAPRTLRVFRGCPLAMSKGALASGVPSHSRPMVAVSVSVLRSTNL